MTGPENPSAFPTSPDGQGHASFAGMSLRDWFAGQALAGMMANADMPFSADVAEVDPRQIAEAVFEIADAMLVARAAQGPQS